MHPELRLPFSTSPMYPSRPSSSPRLHRQASLPFYDCPAIRARVFEDLSAYLGPPNASRREIVSTCHRVCRRTMHLSECAFRDARLFSFLASPAGTSRKSECSWQGERRVSAGRGGKQINWRSNNGGNCRLDGLDRQWMRDEAVPKLSRSAFSDQFRKSLVDDRRIVSEMAS